jgi:hypothetical protein
MANSENFEQPKLYRMTQADRIRQDKIFGYIDSGDIGFDPSDYEDYADRFIAAQEILLAHFPQTRFEILDAATLYLLSKSN